MSEPTLGPARGRFVETSGPLEIGGVRWWLRPGLAPHEASGLLARALHELEAGGVELKRGRRKSLHRLELGGAVPADYLLKVNRYTGRWRRRSKARHELALAAALDARGLPTPVPVAAGERRRGGGWLEACYLLIAIVPGAMDVREALAPDALPPARRRALAQGLGELARRLHDAGLHQADFQPNNFLVRWPGGSPELSVIDFERAGLRARVSDRLRHRALAKLDRELGREPASLRVRFLRGYCRKGDAELRACWRALEREAPALVRRDAAHLRRSVAVPGRRFHAVRVPGFSGLARPGVEPARLVRAAARAAGPGPAITSDPAGADWSLRLEATGVSHGRRVLAKALVLAARGLAPRPLALLCGRDHSVLILERGERAVQTHEVRSNASVEAAWRVLERRLDAYGCRLRALTDGDVALEPAGPGGVRATLLGVEAFGLRSRLGRGRAPGPGAAVRRRSGGPGGRAGPAR